MNLDFKQGVSSKNLHPKIYEAIFESAKVFNAYNLLLTVSSTDEIVAGRLENSFHYEKPVKAFDISIKRLTETLIIKLVEKLRQALLLIDRNFQVVMKKDHIHIELDDRSKTK